MATAEVFSAARSLEIEQNSIVNGSVVGNNLILTKQDGTTVDAGNVRGPTGLTGPQGQDSSFIVRAASPGSNVASLSGTFTLDGVALAVGDRVLLKDQTTLSQNGIWVVASGAWTRATDADTPLEIAGGVVRVQSGTSNGGTRWTTTFKSTDIMNTTAMNWYRMLDGANVVVASISGTTSSTGFVTINHGLPWTPSQIHHRNGNPGSSFAVLWGIDTIGATSFQARFMNGSTAGPLVSLSIGVAYWTFIR